MYDRYQDPTLALAAYNAGPGRLDKALKSGQGIAGLPRETQNYVVAGRMAGGGEVKHFDAGGLNKPFITDPRGITRVPQYPLALYKNPKGSAYTRFMRKVPYLGAGLTAAEGIDALVESDEGTASEFLDPIAAMQGTQGGYERTKKENIYDQMAKDVKTENAPSKPPTSYVPPIYTGMDSEDASTGLAMRKLPNAAAAAAAVPTPVKEKTAMDLFLEQNAADREALGKQRSEDRNMALLAAGLGMLGGESPYAFSNIGKGGLSGVSYLSDANKQRAAQQAALDKNRIAAMHYANVGKYYDSQTLSKEERAELQRQKLIDARITAAKDDYRQFEEMLGKRFKDQYPMASMDLNDPKNRKIYNDFMAQYEPILQDLRKTAGYTTLPAMGNTSSLAQQAAAEKARREANK
jgi:hypothetical protein